MENALSDGWQGITGRRLQVDLRGGDLASTREAAETLLSLARDFPEATLGHVSIADLGRTDLARTEGAFGMGSVITLNERYFADGCREELLRVLRRDTDSGFLVAPSREVRGIITHEFGHVLDIQAEPGWSDHLNDAIQDLARSQGVNPEDASACVAFISEELSRYAALMGLQDVIAESFSEARLAPPGRRLVSLVHHALMAALGRNR